MRMVSMLTPRPSPQLTLSPIHRQESNNNNNDNNNDNDNDNNNDNNDNNKLGLSCAKLSLASAKLHARLSSDQLKLATN